MKRLSLFSAKSSIKCCSNNTDAHFQSDGAGRLGVVRHMHAVVGLRALASWIGLCRYVSVSVCRRVCRYVSVSVCRRVCMYVSV
jgi:hypothetical protein